VKLGACSGFMARKMPVVKGQHPGGVVPRGQDHQGGVGQPDPLILVTLSNGQSLRCVPRAKLGKSEDTPGHLSLQFQLCLDARPGEEHVVEFREDERRQDRWTAVVLVGRPGLPVGTHVMPDGGEQATCIDEDHCKPNPSARTSSTLSARSGSPKSMVPSMLERGRGSNDSSHPSIALRMIRSIYRLRNTVLH
jgi:hypothetical protein